MTKPLLILSIVIGVLVVLGIIVYGMSGRIPSYDSMVGNSNNAALSPEQAGVDDLASEADVSATLDTNFESDIQQLDTELRGL